MLPDLWSLYELMLKSRLFEEAVTALWDDGLISGEMHLGTGEEGIVAGIVSQLVEGDAMALDHRGTPPIIMRGVDPVRVLREILGQPGGLSDGMGGHMHLFSKEDLIASSGIVGAAGPTAVGFGLAAKHLRPGTVAIAFFGDGAVNQGMLMESMNLAAAWNLPVVFVCKDDSWAITTKSNEMTGGELCQRAQSLGLRLIETNGRDVLQVWDAAKEALDHTRSGKGPVFLHASCVHFEAHFLGYQLQRVTRNPIGELPRIAIPLTKSFLMKSGASFRDRLSGLRIVVAAVLATLQDPRRKTINDPLVLAKAQLKNDPSRLRKIEEAVQEEMSQVLAMALQGNVS